MLAGENTTCCPASFPKVIGSRSLADSVDFGFAGRFFSSQPTLAQNYHDLLRAYSLL